MLETRRRLAALAAIFVPGISACSDSDPLDSHGSNATNVVSASNVSSGGSSGGATHDGSGGTDGTGGGTDTAAEPTTGEPAPTREACEHYLDCLAVVSPAELPGAQMGFGPDGTCWDGPPESIEQCIQACVSGWHELHDDNLDEPACHVCAEDGDCAPGDACVNGDCRPANCGDHFVDDNEACDGAVYCASDCSGAGCNPLTHAGCSGGEQCFLLDTLTECLPPQEDLPGLHESCDPPISLGMPTCEVGLACAYAAGVPDCPDLLDKGCCTQICHLQEEPDPCPAGMFCSFWFTSQAAQDNFVGVCVTPG